MDTTAYDVIIIGAGAAGLSSALVLGRARRRVLVLDGGPPRNAAAAHVNGYLGAESISPLDLLETGRRQVEQVGVDVRRDVAKRIDTADGGFVVSTGAGDLTAPHVVLASGVRDLLPDLPGLREGFGIDVFHCPYCHGFEAADSRIAVVGTLPGAGHQARMLRQWSADLVFYLNDTVVLDDEERRVFAARGVEIVDGPVAEIVREDGELRGVRAADGMVRPVDAVFAAPAMALNLDALEGIELETTDTPMGPVVAADPMGATSVPGLWAVGNIADGGSQVITAAAAGSRAGAMINGLLVERDWAEAAQA